MRDEPNGGVRC